MPIDRKKNYASFLDNHVYPLTCVTANTIVIDNSSDIICKVAHMKSAYHVYDRKGRIRTQTTKL